MAKLQMTTHPVEYSMDFESLMCCGITEFHGIEDIPPKEFLACIDWHWREGYYLKGRCGVFSSVNDHAQTLADMIYNNSWGTVTECVRSLNGNSDNWVNAFLWSWDDDEKKRLQDWVASNIEYPDEPDCDIW